MSMIIDGTNGLTFNNATTQASAGSVLQVVSLTNSTQVSTTSTSYITTGLTVSITPKFSTSKVLIIVNYTCYNASLNNGDYHTIYRNSTNLATGGTPAFVQSYANLANNFAFQVAMSHVDSPATTSATSYTAYFKSGSGQNVQTNWSNNSGSITVMEIAG